MKKLHSLLLSLFAFCILLQSCKSCNKCCSPIPPNQGALFISIKQNGQPYPDSLMNGVTMFYYYNGKKITRPSQDPNRKGDIINGDTLLYRDNDWETGALIPGEFSSVYALDAITYSQVNDFYLQFPDGTIDSLNIQIKNMKDNDVKDAPCNCSRQITSVTLNGKELSSTPKLYQNYVIDNAVYLIEK